MQPRETAVLLFLTGCALTDLLDRRIRLWFAACFAAMGIVCGTLGAFGDAAGAPGGTGFAVLPGTAVLALAVVSGGRIGCGDGIALIVIGFYMDAMSVLVALLCALLLSSLFAAAVLVVTHRRKTSYPFLPFLLLGYLLSWAI